MVRPASPSQDAVPEKSSVWRFPRPPDPERIRDRRTKQGSGCFPRLNLFTPLPTQLPPLEATRIPPRVALLLLLGIELLELDVLEHDLHRPKPAWSWKAMMPSSGIFAKSSSTVVSPLTLMVTCLPTHLME